MRYIKFRVGAVASQIIILDRNMENKTKIIKEKKVLKIKKRVDDITAIRDHMLSLDNETIKNILVASGMYDKDMKLTASFR